MTGQAAAPPERRWTNFVFTVGTTAAAAGLLIGLLLQLAGQPAEAGDPLDLGTIVDGLVRLQPWGWTMLGVIVLLLTPPAALLATFVELRASEPRVAFLALAVIGVLVLAVVIALR